jgi:hypothetical protein
MSPTRRKKPLTDLDLALPLSQGDTYEWSKIMLARANFDGTLELLTAAWGRALGYGREELKRKTLGDLMCCGAPATTATVAHILDEHDANSVKVTLHCRDGRGKNFDLHRRHDPHGHKVYLMAEETFAEA